MCSIVKAGIYAEPPQISGEPPQNYREPPQNSVEAPCKIVLFVLVGCLVFRRLRCLALRRVSGSSPSA